MTQRRKAVIYCRVSSPKQVKEGHGLQSQETRCREYAKHKGYKVIRLSTYSKMKASRANY